MKLGYANIRFRSFHRALSGDLCYTTRRYLHVGNLRVCSGHQIPIESPEQKTCEHRVAVRQVPGVR